MKIKKKIPTVFCLVIMLFVSISSYGQRTGLYAGLTHGKASLGDHTVSDSDYGFMVGFHYETKEWGNWLLTADPGIHNKRFALKDLRRNFSGYYLSLPLNIAYNVYLDRDFAFFFQGGMYYDYKIYCKYSGTSRQVEFVEENMVDTDMGVSCAVGVEMQKIRLILGRKQGIKNVTKDAVDIYLNSNYIKLVYYF